MFSKDSKRADRSKNVPPSILSHGLSIAGDIVSGGEVQIDGTVDGDVKCEKLTVGTSGSIKGSVFADEVVIRGRIKGQISSATVVLTRTSRVNGDILHDTLSIEPGAYLEGNCRRLESQSSEPAINLVVSEAKPA